MVQENLLLDSEGHIRITDFGLAKAGLADGGRSNSLIGTMEYMAPEVIQGKGHDKARFSLSHAAQLACKPHIDSTLLHVCWHHRDAECRAVLPSAPCDVRAVLVPGSLH